MLPDKMSKLLRVAISDMEQLDPIAYRFNHEHWHRPSDDKTYCTVCFAGAVMAGTLQADRGKQYIPESYGYGSVSDALHALDSLRYGSFYEALKFLSISLYDLSEKQRQTIYRLECAPDCEWAKFRDRQEAELFLAHIRTVADELESVGL